MKRQSACQRKKKKKKGVSEVGGMYEEEEQIKVTQRSNGKVQTQRELLSDKKMAKIQNKSGTERERETEQRGESGAGWQLYRRQGKALVDSDSDKRVV